MQHKIEYWCDSGANIHSCRKSSVTLEELGYSPEEWNSLSEDQKINIMRYYALESLDWGFKESW